MFLCFRRSFSIFPADKAYAGYFAFCACTEPGWTGTMAALTAKSVNLFLRQRGLVRVLVVLAAAGLLSSMGGCTRRFYRNTADKEVHAILAEKDVHPIWKIE